MKLLAAIRRFSPRTPHYLFAGVLLFRLLSLERLARSPMLLPSGGDMHFYNEWARRILHGELDIHAAFYGMPLYAYFLAGIYRLFGYGPFIPGLLQAVADAGTAVLIYLLALRLFQGGNPHQASGALSEPKTETKIFAGLAGVGWAWFVPAQAYSIILMPTALFTFVFWFVVWRIMSNRAAPGWKECLLLGLLVGLTAMAIATAVFLIPLLVAAVFLKLRPDLGRSSFVAAAAILIGLGIGTSPCWIHNYFIARDPVFLSAHGGVNFWIGNNPTANGYPRFPPGLRAGQTAMLEDSISSAETALGRPLKRSEVAAYWSAKARAYIVANPKQWIGLLLVKFRNFWSAFQYDDLSIITNLREQGIIFPGLYFGVVAAIGLPGLIVAWRKAPASRWITAAIGLLMIGLMTVFVTERYRLPVVPGLLVLGAYGLYQLWRSTILAEYRGIAVYAGLVAGTTVLVSLPQRDPALWALDAYNSGWQALECGNLSLAEEKLDLARRYVPTNPETNFALGNLRLAQGKKNDATLFYLTTLRFEETHKGALNNLAVIAIDEHRYDLAEEWLRRAEDIEPRNAKTHFLLASALWAKGSREAAAAEIETALQLRPGQTEFNQLKQQIVGDVR